MSEEIQANFTTIKSGLVVAQGWIYWVPYVIQIHKQWFAC